MWLGVRLGSGPNSLPLGSVERDVTVKGMVRPLSIEDLSRGEGTRAAIQFVRLAEAQPAWLDPTPSYVPCPHDQLIPLRRPILPLRCRDGGGLMVTARLIHTGRPSLCCSTLPGGLMGRPTPAQPTLG